MQFPKLRKKELLKQFYSSCFQEGSKFVEHASACNVKRTWVNYGEKRDWYNDKQGTFQEYF